MNTQKAVTKRYDILSGPSKDLLFDSIKYAYSKNVIVELDFGIAAAYTAPVEIDPCAEAIKMKTKNFRVTSIMHEDGSGESFIISGYCTADICPPYGKIVIYKPYKFEAYYSTKRRKGSIAFEAQ